MNQLRLLIVDDERLIRAGLRSGVAATPGVEVVGECENGAEAIGAIGSLHPDLVLLDVQMPDCTGLDVIRAVGVEKMPMVIFVTAYDRYAVSAFELNAVDYLLKPFDDERLRQSIERARQRLASRNQNDLAERLQSLLAHEKPSHSDRLVVRNGERYEFVPVDSIDWIESANNYVQLHCGAKSWLAAETLSGLEEKLAGKKFLRVHRRHIVNVSRIVAAHSMFNGTYELEIRDGVRVPTGRQYKEAVQALIGKGGSG